MGLGDVGMSLGGCNEGRKRLRLCSAAGDSKPWGCSESSGENKVWSLKNKTTSTRASLSSLPLKSRKPAFSPGEVVPADCEAAGNGIVGMCCCGHSLCLAWLAGEQQLSAVF